MPAQAATAFGAQAKILGHKDLRKAAHLDGESDISDRCADVRFTALSLQSNGRSDIEHAVTAQDSEAPAFVGRFESERVALTPHVDDRHRIESQFI